MDREKQRALAFSLLRSKLKHQDYDRVVKHAEDYLAFVTGEGTDKMLKQYVPRESEEMFKQRVLLTQSVTGAICSSLIKPFYKVGRNDRVKRIVSSESKPDFATRLEKMKSNFYGSSKTQRGLEYWLKTRFNELEFVDPNAWIVTEWEAAGEGDPQPYPVEVSSKEALNFEIVNGDLKMLFIEKPMRFLAIQQNTKDAVYKDGFRYTCYLKGVTFVFDRIQPEYWKISKPIEWLEATMSGNVVNVGNENYILRELETMVPEVTASRVGYVRDLVTKGRTFVSPISPAEPFLRKSIKTGSELDLTMTLHVFPQKLQYVEACKGVSPEKRCMDGKVADGTTCTMCKGTGKQIHSSAQDAILLPMPEEGAENVMKLDDILVYKAPPIEIANFQNEYSDKLKKEAHAAVFNSQVFVQAGVVQRTATEVEDNMDSVHDTLEPYTDKVSELWVEIVNYMSDIIKGENEVIEDLIILHRYPADPKLKNQTILLNELKLVNDSNAPSFLRESITNDIANIIYSGDELGMRKYETRRRFFPFNGKTDEAVAMLLNSPYIAERTKVLAANFDLIIDEVEKDNKEFFLMDDYSAQWALVEETVDKYLAEINESKADISRGRLNFGALDDGSENEE